MDNHQIETLLKLHNIRPSQHRMQLYKYLLAHRTHPNVEMIYRDLVREIPTLSKTTLYNILSLFVERGIVSLLTIEETETRYDVDISMHGHLKCKDCGRIYDIILPLNSLEIKNFDGFEIKECQVYFKGRCPLCSRKGTAS